MKDCEVQVFSCKGCGTTFGKEVKAYAIRTELYLLLETTVYCRKCNTISTWTFKDNIAKIQMENVSKHDN